MLSQDFMSILVPRQPHFILQLCICDFPIVYMWIGINNTYVGGSSFMCGQKTLHTFTNVNVSVHVNVWTGISLAFIMRFKATRK